MKGRDKHLGRGPSRVVEIVEPIELVARLLRVPLATCREHALELLTTGVRMAD